MPSPLLWNRSNARASSIAAALAPSIAGKIVLTTGVTQNGLGAKFVEEVAKHAPRLLILAGRSASKVQASIDKIASDPASASVPTRALILDLASQAQIRSAAQEVLEYPEEHVDVLVNSAGLMAGPYRTTEEGIELQFGSNHVGHFLFTNLIMPKLLAAEAPRVVNVASDGHRLGSIRFTDPSFSGGAAYDAWEAYGQSKSANILFSRSLAAKLGGKGLRAYSLHPGSTMGTSLAAQGFDEGDLARLAEIDARIGWTRGIQWKDLDECAATHVVAAFEEGLEEYNGVYLEDGNLSDALAETVNGEGDEEKLWKLSEELVGQKFEY